MVDAVSIGPAGETLPGLADPGGVERLAALMDFANCTEASRERLLHEMELLAEGHEIEETEFYAGLLSTGLLLDYLPEEALLVLVRPSEIAEAAWEGEERAHGLRRTKESRGELPSSFPSSQVEWREVEERLASFGRRLEVLPWGAEELTYGRVHALPVSSPPAFLGKLDSFVEEAHELALEGHVVVAVTSHSRRLGEILADDETPSFLPESLDVFPGRRRRNGAPVAGRGAERRIRPER